MHASPAMPTNFPQSTTAAQDLKHSIDALIAALDRADVEAARYIALKQFPIDCKRFAAALTLEVK